MSKPRNDYIKPDIKPQKPYTLSRGNNTRLDYQRSTQGSSNSTSESSNQGVSDNSKYDSRQNDEQQDSERNQSQEDLNNQESRPENSANSDTSVAEQEGNGSKGWTNNTSSTNTGSSKSKIRFSFIKKKGPMTAIILTIVGGTIGIGSLSTAWLPISILDNLVRKFNTQETSLHIRARHIAAVKLTDENTKGMCNTIKIWCRFSRPSNRLLARLEKSNITALGKDGKPFIKTSVLWPNAKPTTYRFRNSANVDIDVLAKDFYKTLDTNIEFSAAFNNASKTRFVSVSDSVFKFVATKFGFGVNDKTRVVDSDEKLKTKVNEEVKVSDDGAIAASEGDTAGKKSFIKKMLGARATGIVKKLGRSGRGSAIILVAGVLCLVGDAPGLVIKVQRDFQMLQLIKYGAIFLTAFGAIKSGDATAAQATALGNVLTKTDKNGKSAMDSDGIKYVMAGQTLPQNDKFKKFSPGMSMIAMLGGIAAVTSSRAKIKACQVIANPVTGAVVDAALIVAGPETGLAAWVALAINVVIGFAISEFLMRAVPPLIDQAMEWIPASFFDSALKFFFGDLTQNLYGEDVGNALASGASHIMGQTGNAGGNMPLSVDQAVAYGEVTKQVQLAYAEEDRATKSPFDATSPNTFLGNIVQKLMPYSFNSSSITSSLSGSISSMGKLVTGSFSMALQPIGASATSDPGDEYRQCEDPGVMVDDVAAGPFCNLIYGIPPKYLNKDPIAIVDHLVRDNNIDQDTGEPIADSDYAKWIDLCTDGTTDQAKNCMIEDNERAEYALYTIDHRVQKSMDEEEETATSTEPTDPPPNNDSSTKKELAQSIIDSGKVIDSSDGGQIAKIANGTQTDVDIRILRLLADLAVNNTFTISSLRRYEALPVGAGANSPHLFGRAVDIGGAINGSMIGYSGHNSNIQKLLDSSSDSLTSNCQIGVPNQAYVTNTQSGCTKFVDIGTGPHLHFGVSE